MRAPPNSRRCGLRRDYGHPGAQYQPRLIQINAPCRNWCCSAAHRIIRVTQEGRHDMASRSSLGCLLGGLALLSTAAFQHAQAQTPAPGEPVGKLAGTIMVRGRLIDVMPLVTSSSISGIGGKVAVGNALAPEVDLSYFFTDNIALELIAATTQHTVSAHNTALGSLTVGQTWVLPPTLTLQYHFNPRGAISPYVGAGLNVSFFYGGSAGKAPINRLVLETSVGPALQAGVDWNFSGHWFANLDVKQIFMSSTAHINSGAIKAKVAIDPLVIGTGIGYRF
jgi:outer membrane protein